MNVLIAADTASQDTWSEGSCSGSRSDYGLSYVTQLSSVSSTNTAKVFTWSSIFPRQRARCYSPYSSYLIPRHISSTVQAKDSQSVAHGAWRWKSTKLFFFSLHVSSGGGELWVIFNILQNLITRKYDLAVFFVGPRVPLTPFSRTSSPHIRVTWWGGGVGKCPHQYFLNPEKSFLVTKLQKGK
jgi:hypothetical protein